nr:hypothetical protein Iba_chr10cCG9650 [Ipomoea batatas]
MDLLLHSAAAGGESPLPVDLHQLVLDLRVDEGREELLCDGLIGAYEPSEAAGVFHLLYGLLLGLLRLLSSLLGSCKLLLQLLNLDLGLGNLLLEWPDLLLSQLTRRMSSTIYSPRRLHDHSIMISMPGTLSLIRSTRAAASVSLSRRPSCSSEDRMPDERFVRLRPSAPRLAGRRQLGSGQTNWAANASLKPIEVSCMSPCGNEAATSSTVWGMRCGNNAVMTTRGDYPWPEVLTSPAGVGVRNRPSCSSPSAEACSTSSIWSKEFSFISGGSDLREKVDSRKSFEGRGGLFIGDALGRSTVAPCAVSLFEVFPAKRHAPVYRSPPSSRVTARMWRRIKRWPGRLGIVVHPEPLLYVAIVALRGERAR